MKDFLVQLEKIEWFDNSGIKTDQYHVIYSIFEAYDDWNQQMLDTWEPNICLIEKKAQEVRGDMWINEIFDLISVTISDRLREKYCAFIERCNLQEECGLDNEIMNFIIRDIAWAYIENDLNEKGFFMDLLDIYKKGYFPCSWLGKYPAGKCVVM